MSRVAIVAFGAVSALGRGVTAVRAGEVGAAARVAIRDDLELRRAGLTRPFAARADVPGTRPDRATWLLEAAIGDCAEDLDRVRPTWRRQRVGLVLGTSSGGMRAAERAFAAVERGEAVGDLEAPTYFGPMASAARTLGMPVDPAVLVLSACASSAVAIGLGARWLERGWCDTVLAGGFDDVSVFVASGFEALRATTGLPPPRPFRLGRDGMSLGEGAAVVALARATSPARCYVSGFGFACDAKHLTAPDRDGAGLARAIEAALAEAGGPTVDLVSAHGTATPFNDAAEWRAMERALGRGEARRAVVHPFKAQIGHTLGAAGVLETLACADAMTRGVFPAAAGSGAVDGEAPARLLDRTLAGRPRGVLKLAAAFGGANAALIVTPQPLAPPRAFRVSFLSPGCHVDAEPPLEELAALTGASIDRLARADGLVRLALAAVGRLARAAGPLAGAGVVVGSGLATIETNARFAARMRERGPSAVEPRVFPYTSPNAVAGECSILFGLGGPSLAVGGGMHAAVEALAVAALLVESGDAERVVVVGVDEGGSMADVLTAGKSDAGAVAVLVSASPQGARARVTGVTLRRGEPVTTSPTRGHAALLPLVGSRVPTAIESATPPDARARVDLVPL